MRTAPTARPAHGTYAPLESLIDALGSVLDENSSVEEIGIAAVALASLLSTEASLAFDIARALAHGENVPVL